ncbi:MAG TPA: FAD-dependent monooxygenase [Acidimicrobiia bacterium]|nr:FAD-dependent monooxygenase [Acidimicrobiia bacterium]
MSERLPVVIVGGGPVGMALGVELGTRGVQCLIVERHKTPQRIPKGQNLTQRTMEHFESWGVVDAIRAARQMPLDYPNSGLTAYRNLMSDYSYPWWRRSMVAEYYSQPNERIPQYETERVLREKVSELPMVAARYGWSGEAVDGHDVRVVSRDTGEEIVVEGEFVIGCDGSHSTIRDSAGISEIMSDHDRRMVLLVFRSPGLNQALERFGQVSFFNIMDPSLEGYWRFLGRVDAAGEFFFHAPVPDDATRDNFDVAGLLHDSVGAEFEVEFDYVGFWDLRFAVADPYRKGPVFVAGDAAHSHPPYGGYGINTGFEDVRNLGWKLAAWFEGWGGEALLDSYGSERQPVFRSTAADFIEKMIDSQREFLSRHDPHRNLADFESAWEERKMRSAMGVADFEPHYEGSPIVSAPGHPSSVGSHEYTARAGHHLPPRAGVFEALGPGFTLVSMDAPLDAVTSFRTAAAECRVPLEVITRERGSEADDYESDLVLVRPDHFVSWVGDYADSALARAVVTRSIGR